MAEFLTPIVRWAQNGPTIDLTVDLIDVKKPKIVLDETTLEFRGFGHGAQGENIYQFNLEFFSKIDYKDSNYKVTERNVSFQLKKQVKGEEWPRLLKSEQKPGWLKVDFDKLRLEDSDKGEEDETERINKISFEQRIKSEVEKAKNDLGIYTRVAWLTIYNLFQAVCFMIILFKLLYNLYQHGKDYRKTHNPHWNLPVPGRYNHIHRIGNAASGYDDLEYVWLINESEYNQLRGREDRPYVGRKQHLKHPSSYFHYNDYTGNGERKGLDLRRKKEEQVNFKTFQASKVEKQNVSSSGNSVKTGTAGDIHDNVNLSSKYKHTDEQNSLTASGFKNASKTKKKAAANAQQEARVEKEEEVLVGKEKDKADGNAQDAGYKVEKEKTTKEEGSTRNEEEDEDDFLDDACKKITECVADVHEKCRHLFDRRISICAVPMNNLFSKKKVINLGELCKGKPSETWLVVRNFEHGTRFLDQKSTSGVYCGTLDGQKIVMDHDNTNNNNFEGKNPDYKKKARQAYQDYNNFVFGTLNVRLHFYDDVSDLLLTCQLAAIIEVINPLVGIVKTGVTAPLMQVGGRNFVLFVLIVPVKEFHHDWTVFVLFFAWAAIEVIRYPFYIITLHRYTNIVIEWLRYSAWIPLYPAGMSCEVLIMYRSIWISKDSKRWEYPLPNTLNISISLSSIIGFCLCAYTPVALQLMKHMWILRKRKLGGQKKFKQQ